MGLCGLVGAVWGSPEIQKQPIHLAAQMEFDVAALLSELVPGVCVPAFRTAGN